MKKILLLTSLLLLAFKIYSLNAIESKKSDEISDEVIVTAALAAGPDASAFRPTNNFYKQNN